MSGASGTPPPAARRGGLPRVIVITSGTLLFAVVLALFLPGLLEEFRKWWSSRAAGEGKPVEVIDAHGFKIEVYDDPAEFEARLRGRVQRVDFEEIDTLGAEPIPFDARRYATSRGVIIRGADGQFADESFGLPKEYKATSGRNMYAPGPKPGAQGTLPRGGHKTYVAFLDRGKSARVSGFGAQFIDSDYPTIGPSAIEIYTKTGKQLVRRDGFRCKSGEAVFRGLIVLDREGRLAPVIHRVHLVNGDEWPSFNSGEGVTLDDFVFEDPTSD